MIIRIDLGQTPPVVSLAEAEDLGSLKAEVALGSHTWIAPGALESLGPDEAEWKRGLAAMVAYAGDHGWTDERGHVRAHVELVDERRR